MADQLDEEQPADLTTFGHLERIPDLRTSWANESADFTPWLAANIGLLSKTIGVDLEVQSQEKEVGPFRADILCKDTIRGDWVLIENQLATTDHSHLGQLLTYAAGLDAVTIIWLAKHGATEQQIGRLLCHVGQTVTSRYVHQDIEDLRHFVEEHAERVRTAIGGRTSILDEEAPSIRV